MKHNIPDYLKDILITKAIELKMRPSDLINNALVNALSQDLLKQEILSEKQLPKSILQHRSLKKTPLVTLSTEFMLMDSYNGAKISSKDKILYSVLLQEFLTSRHHLGYLEISFADIQELSNLSVKAVRLSMKKLLQTGLLKEVKHKKGLTKRYIVQPINCITDKETTEERVTGNEAAEEEAAE